MRRVLIVVALVLFIVQTITITAMDWSRIVTRLSASIVPIACSLHQRNSCTAFSINEKHGLYLTAQHCVETFAIVDGQDDVPQIDGKTLDIVFLSNKALDLAIIRLPTHRPALSPRIKPLVIGTEVGAYGYGYGLAVPIFRSAIVSALLINSDGAEWALFDNNLVGGMSGGPIVDRDGRVVGVNDQSDAASGMSLSIQQILTATQFWQGE